ncbi:MAG TPA: acyltransferase domain-containing protein, partial [Chthoniobacterales bacterium]|nr:acyltransferase domain-containing protein [Chthoniobacterales bacterium]
PIVVTGIEGKPRVAFLFPGQGSQYVGMGRQLFCTHPGFRSALERCDAILKAQGLTEKSLTDVLYAESDSSVGELIDRTEYAQPALFALEYALAELWLSWGISPEVLLGHSIGEYAAACVAGVFSLEDGLRLVVERARLIASIPVRCATAAVFADARQVLEIVTSILPKVEVSGQNSSRETLIAGSEQGIEAALAILRERKVDARRLKIPHAPHSAMVEPILDAFEAFARQLTYHRPRVPIISNLTGRVVEEIDARYWGITCAPR